MLKLVSKKIDTYLTSLWRHERYLFFVFRSSIDRPLSIPQSLGSNNYFSIPEQKYIINNWGFMKKNYFGWSGVHFIFSYITVACRHTIVFYCKDYFSNINRYVFDVSVTSWALFVFWISWNFARDISTVFEDIKHLRSRAPEKYFTRLLKLKWL
jgi:hypothetical protein